ncbi:740_t:CDS:2 [Ambispora leptoticha]|uniref:740_t:CDS:1 n=1 Tax=Ambispora leptoticha TaxID=144679 RepID=A0A9N9G5Q4_9GLOM|nr:740_t:CDS:2 [Ambispora leptoticha]
MGVKMLGDTINNMFPGLKIAMCKFFLVNATQKNDHFTILE